MNSLTLIGGVAAAGLVGILVGWFVNSFLGKRSVVRARGEAEEILHQVEQDAERQRKAAALAAREETQKTRRRTEKDIRERRTRLNRQQSSLKTQEKRLKRRMVDVQTKTVDLDTRLARATEAETELETKQQELAELMAEENSRLEKVASLPVEDAREMLLENIRKQARFEITGMIKKMREEAQQEAEMEAQKIMALAIERSASDFSTTRTTAAITLENDRVKGRLIGHEGKNIKAFEAATGMQLVVDDTPNQVLISGFHPVKREIARLTLEKLAKDGNIHPRRIEETVRKMRRRTGHTMRKAAEEALKELKIRDVHPEMINLLGRLHYRTSYGQNVLEHSKEVAYLTGIMATELGLDETLGRRSGMFHDIGKAIDYEREGTHPEIGEQVARRYGEHEVVINAIASHHEDCEVISPISILVAAADALSGARPGARRRTLADYIRRVEALETIASSYAGVSESYAIQAGRELRVIARHDKVTDEESEVLATDIAQRIEAEVDYPGKIKVTVIRELWATQLAR